jgi:hypothetical protein
MAPISQNTNPYYSPTSWMPHITLAYGDVTDGNLDCLIKELTFRPICWDNKIDNLTMIDESKEDNIKISHQYQLGEKDSGRSDRR